MTMSPEFRNHLLDVFQPLGAVTAHRMFGGGGLFLDGAMFALVANDVVYLKADDENRATFEAAGMGPFTYERRGKPAALSYWRIPDELLDDEDELCAWAKRAWAAGRRAAAMRPKKRPKKRRKAKAGA